MEVALIPPISLLEDTNRTQMQLMLPHLLYNPKYANVYSGHCLNPNQYVIFDNGAAEHKRPHAPELFGLCTRYRPQEFALPDAMGESDVTHDMGKAFLRKYGRQLVDLNVKIGYVATGKDLFDAMEGLDRFIGHFASFVDTIYIPRLLVRAHHLTARVEMAMAIHEKFGEAFEIHLFGASRWYPGEVRVASRYPFIRSIDTSIPYCFAFDGRPLRPRTQQVTRPQSYFQRPSYAYKGSGAAVERYLKWANANTH